MSRNLKALYETVNTEALKYKDSLIIGLFYWNKFVSVSSAMYWTRCTLNPLALMTANTVSSVLLLEIECLGSLDTAVCPPVSLDVFQACEAYLHLLFKV